MRLFTLTVLSAATLLSGCAHHAMLAELPLATWEHPPSVLQATAPRMPDGKTVFAMADIDNRTSRTLQAFQAPRQVYPSVGGDILRGLGENAAGN
jgi:hypothetical protein